MERLQIKKAVIKEDFSYLNIDLYLSYGLSCRQHMYTYTYITAFWSKNSQQKVNPSQEHRALVVICWVKVTVILNTLSSNLTYFKKKNGKNILEVVLKELGIAVCSST